MQPEKYKTLFLQEAEEKITELNQALLQLEKIPDDIALANNAMRAVHTLKSSSAAMGFTEMSHLAHSMENVLEAVRKKQVSIGSDAMEALFAGADSLQESVILIRHDGQELPTQSLQARLNAPSKKKQAGAALKITPSEPITAIKVQVKTLDRLMNLTEELLVENMKFAELFRLAQTDPEKTVPLADLQPLGDALNRLVADLQFHVTQARMVPVGQLFEQFPRMIRDLAKSQNKIIDFEMEGQSIELDRTSLEQLHEPLLHLLRNSVDHGIETSGKITLVAERLKDQVLISVKNTGQALSWKKILNTALKRQLIDAQTHERYEQNPDAFRPAITELLFHPQFSTSKKVTETSGRGVGLSIVKNVVESLGGVVQVESEPETGTCFSLQMPITVAILQALLVHSAGHVFAIPFSQVDRIIRVSFADIKSAFDHEVAVVDGEDIPLLRLDNRFGLKKSTIGGGLFKSQEELNAPRHQLKAELMVVTKGQQIPVAGIVIDDIHSEQDIVVKPLIGILKQIPGFAGITLLGDGKPALILDMETLIQNPLHNLSPLIA
jgi:two-component system, chemotaxis family, sensor kinase CheA